MTKSSKRIRKKRTAAVAVRTKIPVISFLNLFLSRLNSDMF